MDYDAMREAYLRTIREQKEQTHEELIKENKQLKSDLDALQKRYNRVLNDLQNSIDSVLRIAREGKSET